MFLIVILCSAAANWQFFTTSAEAPVILPHLGMSLDWYSDIIVAAGLIGGFSSYGAAIADRIGRIRVIVFTTLLVSLISIVIIPLTSGSKIGFTAAYLVLGLIDAVGFVAVPSLARDYSPSLGRGTIMGITVVGINLGFWTASTVVSHTSSLSFQDEYRIAGAVGVVMSVICFFLVKELSPALRNQVLQTEADKMAATVRAAGDAADADAEAALAKRWRQVMRDPWLWLMPVGSSLFLIFYVTIISFAPIYYTVVLHFSLATANGVNTFYFGIACAANIVFGIVADVAKVRKPIWLIGWVVSVAFTILFALERHPSFIEVTLTVSIMVAAMAMCTTQFYAEFSERAEKINPMAIAAAFALAQIISRVFSSVQTLVFPHVVGSLYANRTGWDVWFIVAIVGLVISLPLMLPGFTGRWSPRRASADIRRHKEELAAALSERQPSTDAATPSPVFPDSAEVTVRELE
jgi:sugar phosphate permease